MAPHCLEDKVQAPWLVYRHQPLPQLHPGSDSCWLFLGPISGSSPLWPVLKAYWSRCVASGTSQALSSPFDNHNAYYSLSAQWVANTHHPSLGVVPNGGWVLNRADTRGCVRVPGAPPVGDCAHTAFMEWVRGMALTVLLPTDGSQGA